MLLLSTMFFVACGKDPVVEEPDKEATIQKFISVSNATLVEDEMPQATSDQAIVVTMNKYVISGGSSTVSIVSERPARKILVGMKDQVGYYELTPNASRDNAYSFVMLVVQNIALSEGQDSFTVMMAIEDENGDISKVCENTVNLKAVGTGTLQVSLSFDTSKDLDLHLIEPEYNDQYGEPVPFDERHIYYGYSVAYNSGGELNLESNAGCIIDEINNENITYNENAFVAPGTYKVYVDLWENCDKTVPTNYLVTVFYRGSLIASRSATFEANAPGTYNPINESYVDEHEPFLTFTIGDKGQN